MKGPPSSTGAEIQAAVRAIKIAEEKGYSGIRIFTDSETVRTAKDRIAQNQTLASSRNDVQQLEAALRRYPNVEIIHVPGHGTNPNNQEANRLARGGANMYRTGHY